MAAEAVVSAVAERIVGLIEEQARYHINLVRGAETEVRSLAEELNTIRNVLDDAEMRGYKEKTVKDWLVRLEHTSYEMEDVLDEWDYAILKLRIAKHPSDVAAAAAPKQKVRSFIPSSSCLCFKKVVVRHHIAKKILDVKAKLDEILREKDRYNFVMSQPNTDPLPKSWRVQSTSSVEFEKVHGRDSDRDYIVKKLIVANGDSSYIVSVVGVGGLGKTTLAQLVYNDSRVEKFFELRIWICVSDTFDETGIAKGIIESVNGSCPANINQLEVLLQKLRGCIDGKKFLLVLDDVWNEDYTKWEPLKLNLKYGAPGSKILVTTRNEKVARTMGTIEKEIFRPRELSTAECWLLLCRISLSERNKEECEKFRDIGEKIASKCKGLPLAANVLGSLLRFKNTLEEWENVLASEIWQLEEAEVQLFPHLLLSYNELSPTLKRCFSYCAVFPKDSRIHVEKLIESWIAQGYLSSNVENGGDMELKGREYFNNLAMRSLFQDLEEKSGLDEQIISCKMHDIVHDFARSLRKDRNIVRVEAGMKTTTCQRCSSLVVSSVKKYRSLVSNGYICDCLTSLRVLNISYKTLDGIPQEIERLIHLRWLDLSENLLSSEVVKAICKLYNLQFLRLSNCKLNEVPLEIGNLIHVRHLDLSHNQSLKELPKSICTLHELRILNIASCDNLCALPEGIDKLINLKHLHNLNTGIRQFPQGLAQLIRLRTLSQFDVGRGCGKLAMLKNLNHLSGFLKLNIKLSGDTNAMVEDAKEGLLRNKVQLHGLRISFSGKMDEKNSCVRMDVIDALEPHPSLSYLDIYGYKGSKLGGWIASPLYQLRSIKLSTFNCMLSLPPLGKLPCLEEIYVSSMEGLEFVGREFLGITTSTGGMAIGFPKLRKLAFMICPNWKEWEDITEEEEDSASVTVMPCLTEVILDMCGCLRALPLEYVRISRSTKLVELYKKWEGAAFVSSASTPGLVSPALIQLLLNSSSS